MLKLILIASFLYIPVAWSQEYISGISPEAISMPSLPGSVEGLPLTINESESKGEFRFSIDIKVPKGINNLNPDLKINYSSGDGQSEFGLGWRLNLQSITLDKKRGVPTYTSSDRFWGPDGELVRIERSESSNKFYAPFINKNQNIYEFDESSKTWILHKSDGKKLYFGQTNSSVIEDSKKTYKWFVERIVDTVGNKIEFEYSKIQGYPYLLNVKYAYKDGTPQYTVQFNYEDREDVLDSYKSTYLIKQSKRCSEIKVKSGSDYVIRAYEFQYRNQIKTVLKEVQQYGEGKLSLDPPMPPIKFEYSEFNIDPNTKSLKLNFFDNNIPPSLNKPRAVLVDINRDSFPDVLETSRYGAKVWINDKEGGFYNFYKMPEFISVLGEEQTKLLDVDGDRVVDFIATGLYPKFFKGGVLVSESDFGFSATPSEVINVPRYSIGASNVKTMDINADGRLDIIAREPGNFKSFISTSTGNWDRARDFNLNTGAFDLSSPYTFFADMNGDGLTDIVFARPESVTYLPNKGTGEFADPLLMSFSNLKPLILDLFKIGIYNFVIDINGDGYSDLVSANESSVAIAINEGNGTFGETILISNVHDDPFNLKGVHITVADINGNSTSDIVWTNDFGDWRYLDLSQGLSGFITKLDNGLGLKTYIEYAYSSTFGENSESSLTILPYPVPVVKTITEKLGNSEEEVRKELYKYFGGYYDALDNDFRGYHLVEKIEEGDSTIESSLSKTFYEQGRNVSKIHQQLFPLKKIEYAFDLASSSVGPIMRGEEYTVETLATFENLDSKNVGFPYVSQTIYTEGDFEGNSRQHKTQRSITLSSSGFIEKDKLITFLDLSQILKQEEIILAIENDNYILNRVCEKNTSDGSNALLLSKRYYYDGENTLCSLSSGLLTKQSSWTGSAYETKYTYTYYSFGSMSSFADSLGHVTSLGYDALDINLIEVTNPANHVNSAVYNTSNGVMTSLTNENGLTTSLYYDLYLRLTKVVGPGDSLSLPTIETIYEFGNSLGQPSSLVTKKREKSGAAGTFDSKEYFDGKGRSIYKITEGPTSRFVLNHTTYNKRNEKKFLFQNSFTNSFSIPAMDGVRYFENRYDSLKRPLLVFNPEHSSSEPSYKEFYHLVGEVISYDEERKVSYEYKDSLGRRIRHKDALENEVNYVFDPLDQLIKITDPQGGETVFGYDSQKRRVCKIDPTTGLTKYSYNSENLVVEKNLYGYVSGHHSCIAPSGVTPRSIGFEYNDDLNRLTKIDFPFGSNTEDIIQSYDEISSSYSKGKMTSVNFGAGSKKFDYDIYGNKSKTTLNIGVSSYQTEEVFDVLGRVERIIYPTLGSNSLTVRYEFDEGSNIRLIKDDSSSYQYVQDITYSPLAQVEEGIYGNNTKFSLSYDTVDQSYWLTDVLLEKIGTPNTLIQQIKYSYDKASNITERNDLKNSFEENYSYDDLHRLASFDYRGTPVTVSYDEIGNILSNDGRLYIYNSNRKQILNSVNGDSYSFDAFGNISQDASRNYSFDWNNRLKSIVKSSLTTTYDYDENGIRVIKTTPSSTTIYIDKYTELRGTDVVRHVYRDRSLVASIDELNNITFNHADHLGSSNLKTDSAGAVVKRIEYLPFGDKRFEAGLYNKIKNRFTGQYEDEETVLYYYQQRYYDPVLSRFISADPLYSEEMDKRGINSQELNLYSYVKNNPIKYTDPDGQQAFHPFNPVAAMFDPANEKAANDMVKGLGTALTGIAGSTALPAAAGGAILTAKGVAAVGQTAIPYAMAYGGLNPQYVEKAIGSGLSFFEGFLDGFTRAHAPNFDGRYAPDGFGGPGITVLAGEAGKMLGANVNDLYGEVNLGPTEISTPTTDSAPTGKNDTMYESP